MKNEKEEQRYIEATKCENCLDWHHHCKAECCKILFLNIDQKELNQSGKILTIRPEKSLGRGERRYYQARGVECIRGVLRFKKERIIVAGKKVIYFYPCKFLKGNLCGLHETDFKPEICKLLTLESANLPNQSFELTNNCLFKYKCKGV